MTWRFASSATPAVGGADWRAGAIAIAAAAVAFAAYCQAHGWIDASPVPIEASLRWGLLAGAPAGALAWLLWRSRHRVVAFAARGSSAAPLAAGGLFALLLVGGSVAHLVAGRGVVDDVALQIAGGAFDLLPLAAAVAAAAAGVLAAITRSRPTVENSTAMLEWLAIPEAPDLRLRTAEVTAIRAAGNYCEVETGGGVYLIRVPIKVLGRRLEPAGFVRVHRSALVNLSRLLAVERAAGQVRARLDDGSLVPIGQAYRDALETALVARSSLPVTVRP